MCASLRQRNCSLLSLPIDCHCEKLQALGACPTVPHKCQSLPLGHVDPSLREGLRDSVSLQVCSKGSTLCTRNQWHPMRTPGESLIPAPKCLLCSSLSPLFFCQVTRSNEENRANKGWREKNQIITEFESWKGAKTQIRKESGIPLCSNVDCCLGKGNRLPTQRSN